jgi:exonuclease SbcC
MNRAAWAEVVEVAATGELVALGERAAAAVKAATEHREAAAEQRRELEIQSSSELEQRRMTLHSELDRHRRALAQVNAELGAITTLDELRSRTEKMQAALSELHHLLLDSNFVQYAVENRQHALLASASLVLGEVTGGRFGFSADFRIVDNETGQARDTRTLSGGETFLASLALALGLVEVTARSGGRLEALFLDEGFGSLDPNALQQALGALERRAQSGRLVALISHVPLVAEQIERVLQVSKDHEGSQVRFLTARERAEFAFADVAQAAL